MVIVCKKIRAKNIGVRFCFPSKCLLQSLFLSVAALPSQLANIDNFLLLPLLPIAHLMLRPGIEVIIILFSSHKQKECFKFASDNRQSGKLEPKCRPK